MAKPGGPVLVDLATLRLHADAMLAGVDASARDQVRALLFGFDAIVVLPDSAPATCRLTGFAPL